jgi:ribosomal protein S18 acetylase RimI-like enzyme
MRLLSDRATGALRELRYLPSKHDVFVDSDRSILETVPSAPLIARIRAGRAASFANRHPEGLGYYPEKDGSFCWVLIGPRASQVGQVVDAVMIANRQTASYRWEQPFERRGPISNGQSGGARWAVVRIWTHPQARRRGFARRLFTVALGRLGVEPGECAWVAPVTIEGKALAIALSGPDGIWLA